MSFFNMAGAAGVARILSIVVFMGVSMCAMGIPLAVLPGFLHRDLHCSAVVTGVVLGIHSVTMLMARPFAGRIGDRVGPKQAAMLGLLLCAGSGLLTWIAISLVAQPVLALTVLTLGRLLLGAGSGCINTGTLSRAIGAIGPSQTARVISYSGVLGFTSLAFAPPVGAAIADAWGSPAVGAAVLAMNIVALGWALCLATPKPVPGKPVSFMQTFGRIAPMGITLALGAAGFAATTTFVTLYFAEQGWPHAPWAMTSFGIAYVGMRILFTGAVDRYGPTRVTLGCFVAEILGLGSIGLATVPYVAMIGAALLGIGQSLLYASLAVKVVASVSPSNRSSAIGAFSLCFDLSLILGGPLFGLVASIGSFRWVFLSATLLSMAGMACAWRLHVQGHAESKPLTDGAAVEAS